MNVDDKPILDTSITLVCSSTREGHFNSSQMKVNSMWQEHPNTLGTIDNLAWVSSG